MIQKNLSLKLFLTFCGHLATIISTVALVIIGPIVSAILAIIYKWQDKTQDATFYLALLVVLLVSRDDLMYAYERSYNKYIELYRSEYPEEKE